LEEGKEINVERKNEILSRGARRSIVTDREDEGKE